MKDRLPRLHVFPHESGYSGADLVELEVLGDPGVGHTIKGLLVVDSGRGEVTALRFHLLKDGFVDEKLVFAAIAPAAASFWAQVPALEKDVGPFCNDGGQERVHSW